VDGTDEMTEAGTETTKLDGTEVGTLNDWTITNDGDEANVTSCYYVNNETYDNPTTTGIDHDDGSVTDDGYVTVTTAVDGTDWIKDDGYDDGRAVNETITAVGDDWIVI
jgi:hypothetical protein